MFVSGYVVCNNRANPRIYAGIWRLSGRLEPDKIR